MAREDSMCKYPGAIYHVMNRGDRRKEIFQDDLDRESSSQKPWAKPVKKPGGSSMPSA